MSINTTPRVNTTMGMRRKNPLCYKCRKEVPGDQLLTLNVYNQPVCPDCAGEPVKSALRGVCSEGNCACSTAGSEAEA